MSTCTPEPTDADLCEQVRRGDASAFTALFTRHHAAGLRAAVAIGGPGLAEEHTAEAFTRILALLQHGRGPREHFRAYLVATIRNAHLNHLRRAQRCVLTEEVPDVATAAGADAAWSTEAAADAAGEAYAELPERWRQALWLHTVERRPLAEVAEIMGISKRATAQLTFRARAGLRLGYHAARAADPTTQRCRTRERARVRAATTLPAPGRQGR